MFSWSNISRKISKFVLSFPYGFGRERDTLPGFKFNTEKFMQEINNKWKSKICPMCGHQEWIADEMLTTTIPIDKDNRGIIMGGKIIPLVSVTCKYCGNTILVNAKLLGCIEENDSQNTGKEGGE